MKHVIGILILLGSFGKALSQDEEISLPIMIPPSPEAAALGKYGEVPVDMSTGVPNISIPLYEIKTPRFNLPISLSYHAGGIKVDEMATWVGLGWSLNAGGVITRNIIGVADNILSPNYIPIANEISSKDKEWLEAAISSDYDTEPDEFYYNFLTKSGNFTFGPDGKPLLITSSPLKINVHDSQGFVITDEQGNIFNFFDKGRVAYESYPSGPIGRKSGIATWYLTSMISADKSDTVKFYYEEEPSLLTEYSNYYSQGTGDQSTIEPEYPYCTEGPLIDPVVRTTIVRRYNQVNIKTIKFKGGKVEFLSKPGRKDAPGSSLDSIEIFSYDFGKNEYEFKKAVKLETGYFYSPQDKIYDNDEHSNRLRLDKVIKLNKKKEEVQSFFFEYDPETPPPLYSLAQDLWGFYNGQLENKDLIEKQTIAVRNRMGYIVYKKIGKAIRTSSEQHMKAGSLKRIVYPTQGYTEYEYEPHKYIHARKKESEPRNIYANADASEKVRISTINTKDKHDFYITINISKLDGLINMRHKPYVELKEVSTGNIVFHKIAETFDNIAISQKIDLGEDKEYELYANYDGDDERGEASIMISYKEYLDKQDVRDGIGLRIKAIKNFDSEGKVLFGEEYEYGGDGIGTFISSELALKPMNYTKSVTFNHQGGTNYCLVLCKFSRTFYTGHSVYSLTSFRGSPIIYTTVSKYKTDNSQQLGKSTFSYSYEPETIIAVPPAFQGGLLGIPNKWGNGKLIRESHFRYEQGNYIPVSKKKFEYQTIQGPEGRVFMKGRVVEHMGSCYLDRNFDEYYYFDYPIYTGVKLPKQTTEILYDNTGENKLIETTTNYYYDNLEHQQPTKIVTTTSSGGKKESRLRYPHEMAAEGKDGNGIYGEMVSKNMLAPLIEEEKFIDNSFVSKKSTAYYRPFPHLIVPQSVSVQVGNNEAETRLRYHRYSREGNVLSQSKEGDMRTSYQWGYNGLYPIAACENADPEEFYYTGFEENGVKGAAHTGSCHSGNVQFKTMDKVVPGLNGKAYAISYWYKSGGKWAFSGELPYTGQVLTGPIDDVRIYPVGSSMTTYTYHPLNGVTSATDANGITVYYEYDSFSRLKTIKDEDGNVIKHFKYNYQSKEAF